MKRKRWLLIILVGLLGLCVVVGMLANGEKAPPAEVAVSATPRPTATERPTSTPTATLTAEETLVKLSAKALGHAPTLATITGDVVVIEGDELPLTEGVLISSAVVSLRQLAPAVFDGLPNVNLLTLKVKAPFTDAYGKESNDVALRFTVTRDLNGKVTWINLDGRRLDALLSSEPGCSLYVHPGLRIAWEKYTG